MFQKEKEQVAKSLFRVVIVLSREAVKIRGSLPASAGRLYEIGSELVQHIDRVLLRND